MDIICVLHKSIKTNLIILLKLQNNRTVLSVDFLQKADIVINHGKRTWSFANETKEYDYATDITPAITLVSEAQFRKKGGDTLTPILFWKNTIIFSNQPGMPTDFIKHVIDARDNSPISVPSYRLSAYKKCFLTKELDSMFEQGVIQKSDSPWC